MRHLDTLKGSLHEVRASTSKYVVMLYRPTLSTTKACMPYTIAELSITLFIVAMFVNSATLIVAEPHFRKQHAMLTYQGCTSYLVILLVKELVQCSP
jgi:Mn2+/Fe2+ NRAMP family transporter